MPDFGSPFSGMANDRKLRKEELIRAIRFLVAAEYEAVHPPGQSASCPETGPTDETKDRNHSFPSWDP